MRLRQCKLHFKSAQSNHLVSTSYHFVSRGEVLASTTLIGYNSRSAPSHVCASKF
nr:hypothetical protein REQ54_02103 [Rhizobium sp. Q54]